MNLARPTPPNPFGFLPPVPTFELASDDIADGATLGLRHVATDDGGGESPGLTWTGAPKATQSFAITCFDPDAPTVSGFWHWLVADIPADVSRVPRDAASRLAKLIPEATAFRNDAGTTGYAGAAPPPGDRAHRYMFTVHALTVDRLLVPTSVSPAVVAFHIVAATVGRAHLVSSF